MLIFIWFEWAPVPNSVRYLSKLLMMKGLDFVKSISLKTSFRLISDEGIAYVLIARICIYGNDSLWR